MPRLATPTEATSPTSVGVNRLVTYGLTAAIAATTANGLVLAVALALGVPGGFPLAWVPVLASSAIPAVAAIVAYGAIARFSSSPNRAFVIVAAVVLALSFVPFAAPPPELDGASWSVFATLATMHVVAAVAIVGALIRVPRGDDQAGETA